MKPEIILPWDKILYLMNGTDVNGFPLSVSNIVLHEVIDAQEVNILEEYNITDTPVTVFMSGGCAVATFNFPQKEQGNFNTILELCEKWLKNIESTADDDKLLSLIITPLLMEGTFTLLLTDLVFAEGYFNGEEYRLILGFDNNQTQPFVLEGIDIAKVIYEIDSELNRELDEIRHSIEEAETIVADQKSDNPYEKAIMEKFSNLNFKKTEETEENHSGIRIAQEEEE